MNHGLDPEAQDKEKIYPELARANLLRMRGDYKGAIDQCLSILKRYPEDPDAHTLIGDIYAEQGDLGQAAQWYELALDLNPNSAADKQKLRYVQERARDREAASAAQQLGLPPERPSLWIYASVLVVLAIVVGVGAFALGRQADAKRTTRTVPITAPGGETSGNPTAEDPAAPVIESAAEDAEARSVLAANLPGGINLLSVIKDPRTQELIVTYGMRADESERAVAAEVARAALNQFVSSQTVILRGVKSGRLAHVATADRARLAAYTPPAVGDATSLANAILTNEWSPAGVPTTPPPVAPSNPSPDPDQPVSNDPNAPVTNEPGGQPGAAPGAQPGGQEPAGGGQASPPNPGSG